MIFLSQEKKGFTLIELIIVISVIAVLSTIVLAAMSQGRVKARDTQRISDINQVRLALRLYRDVNTSYPPADEPNGVPVGGGDASAIDAILYPTYLPAIIKDPNQGTDGYGYYYSSKYKCNGVDHVVLLVLKMENSSSGNMQSICGAPNGGSGKYKKIANPDIFPSTDSYIVIIK